MTAVPRLAAADAAAAPAVEIVAQAAFAVLLAVGALFAVALLVRLVRRPVNWEERVSRLAWRPWSRGDVWRLAGLLLGLHAAANLVAVAVLGRRPARADAAALPMTILVTAAFHGAVLAACAAALVRRGISWASAFGLARRGAWRAAGQGLLIGAAAAPFVIGYNWVWQHALRFLGHDPGLQPVLELMARDAPLGVRIYLLVLAVAVAPVAEETLFRGVLLPVLARRFGGAAGVIFSAAVFAALHLHAGSMAPLFVVGVALGAAALYSGSLWAPIALHAAFNAVNLALLFAMAG